MRLTSNTIFMWLNGWLTLPDCHRLTELTDDCQPRPSEMVKSHMTVIFGTKLEAFGWQFECGQEGRRLK